MRNRGKCIHMYAAKKTNGHLYVNVFHKFFAHLPANFERLMIDEILLLLPNKNKKLKKLVSRSSFHIFIKTSKFRCCLDLSLPLPFSFSLFLSFSLDTSGIFANLITWLTWPFRSDVCMNLTYPPSGGGPLLSTSGKFHFFSLEKPLYLSAKIRRNIYVFVQCLRQLYSFGNKQPLTIGPPH